MFQPSFLFCSLSSFQVSSWLCWGILPAPGPLPHRGSKVPKWWHLHSCPTSWTGSQLPMRLPGRIQELSVRDAGVQRVQQLSLPERGHLPLVHLEQLHVHLPKGVAGQTLHRAGQLRDQSLQERSQLYFIARSTQCLPVHLSRGIHWTRLQHQRERVR